MPGKNVLHFQTVCLFVSACNDTSVPAYLQNDDDVMSCSLYLWKWSDKIIISDIDGTITKYIKDIAN